MNKKDEFVGKMSTINDGIAKNTADAIGSPAGTKYPTAQQLDESAKKVGEQYKKDVPWRKRNQGKIQAIGTGLGSAIGAGLGHAATGNGLGALAGGAAGGALGGGISSAIGGAKPSEALGATGLGAATGAVPLVGAISGGAHGYGRSLEQEERHMAAADPAYSEAIGLGTGPTSQYDSNYGIRYAHDDDGNPIAPDGTLLPVKKSIADIEALVKALKEAGE